jgi:ribonuclease Z
MAANIKVQKLILGDFSLRYSQELIDAELVRLCKHYGIKIPVYRIKTGKVQRNVLSTRPAI